MSIPLSEEQKEKLRKLESALRLASSQHNYKKAREATIEIQKILKPTGHEARLLQAKNYLFETALETGLLDTAIPGFIGVRQKAAQTTRLYLEATTLLAICYLRKKDLKSARPFMVEAFRYEKNIKSKTKRTEFKVGLAKRFDEEALLASLEKQEAQNLDASVIQNDAGKLIRTKHDDEILEMLGSTIPAEAVQFTKDVHDEATKLLTHEEKLLLPSPPSFTQKKKLGSDLLAAFKRVIWKSLCDPQSEIYKAWFNNGLQAVLDKKYITTAIVSALAGLSAGGYAIAVYLSALIIKIGVEVFCETYTPANIMKMRK